MLTDDQCRKIAEKEQKEYYDRMATQAQSEEDRLEELSKNCYDAVAENEIYLLRNEEFNSMSLRGGKKAGDRFDVLLNKYVGGNDYRHSGFNLSSIKYKIDKDNGFQVFFSEHDRQDVSKVTVKVIKNISDYISEVLYTEENDNSKVFYRGHGNWRYKLVPGIYREDNIEILQNESSYIKEIISSYPSYFKECKSALDFLSVLQHSGFPTRLLDFTENPLIALYMACDNNSDCDADVIRISVPKEYFKYYDSDTVSVLSNIALAEDDFLVKNSYDNIDSFNKDISIEKLVHLIRNEKPFFKPKINPEHLEDTILFVKPKQDFERISQQSGLFALFGINNEKGKRPKIEYMNPPCNIEHLIIPQEFKKIILEGLSQININEASVYCDMEHVSKYYTKKSKSKEIQKYIERKKLNEENQIKELINSL